MTQDIDAVQESVKLALDAAEAAADVTAEYNKLRNENQKLVQSVSAVYKHARTVAIVAGVAVSAVLILAMAMHFRSVGSLETIAKTSREALVVFAENVDDMNKSVKQLQQTLVKQEELLDINRTLKDEIVALRETSDKPFIALDEKMNASFAQIQKDNERLEKEIQAQLGKVSERLEASQKASADRVVKSTTSVQSENRKGSEATAGLSKAIDAVAAMQKRTLEHLQTLVQENSRLMTAIQENARQITYP